MACRTKSCPIYLFCFIIAETRMILSMRRHKSCRLIFFYFKTMAKQVTVIIEKASDGGFCCYMKDDVGKFGLCGFGATANEAKEDLLEAYEETKEIGKERGMDIPELSFVFKYDMQAFFNYFPFLNVSKIAERAGINPSQMRQYASGVSKASQKQYDKMRKAISAISHELSTATF